MLRVRLFRVLIMRIYTKAGDDGTTSLFGGKRVKKSNIQIYAYGAVDELSSVLGVTISFLPDKKHLTSLSTIQIHLHKVMAYLSGAPTDLSPLNTHVRVLENEIDSLTKTLPPLSKFILPQGSKLSSFFHVTRTVCRRAERDVVSYIETRNIKSDSHQIIFRYLNRLSDLLFMYARLYNTKDEHTV